jgi:hypothetical protein
VLTGVVRSAAGSPLPGQPVALQVRGPHRWRTIGSASSDSSGTVFLPTPAAEQTSVFRLVSGAVPSQRWRIALVPTLQVTVTPGTTTDIAVVAAGGRAGDPVTLLRRVKGQLVPVLEGALDAGSVVHFQVTPGKKASRYVVRLPATPAHAAARVAVLVPPLE